MSEVWTEHFYRLNHLKNLQFVVLCVLQGLNLTTLAILKRSTPKLDTYFIHLVVQMFLGNLIITSESRKRNVNTTQDWSLKWKNQLPCVIQFRNVVHKKDIFSQQNEYQRLNTQYQLSLILILLRSSIISVGPLRPLKF